MKKVPKELVNDCVSVLRAVKEAPAGLTMGQLMDLVALLLQCEDADDGKSLEADS